MYEGAWTGVGGSLGISRGGGWGHWSQLSRPPSRLLPSVPQLLRLRLDSFGKGTGDSGLTAVGKPLAWLPPSASLLFSF